MSRSGYSEDCETLNLWRGTTVARAIRGKRGQALLREMVKALAYENDEQDSRETPAHRWERMRKWAVDQIWEPK